MQTLGAWLGGGLNSSRVKGGLGSLEVFSNLKGLVITPTQPLHKGNGNI